MKIIECREFEDNMSKFFAKSGLKDYFPALTEAYWHDDCTPLLTGDHDFDAMIRHATECSDCSNSLYQYFLIREKVDYHAFPCFHLAYYSATDDEKERCIDADSYCSFAIILEKDSDKKAVLGIGIGFCPWCGIALPVTPNEQAHYRRFNP